MGGEGGGGGGFDVGFPITNIVRLFTGGDGDSNSARRDRGAANEVAVQGLGGSSNASLERVLAGGLGFGADALDAIRAELFQRAEEIERARIAIPTDAGRLPDRAAVFNPPTAFADSGGDVDVSAQSRRLPQDGGLDLTGLRLIQWLTELARLFGFGSVPGGATAGRPRGFPPRQLPTARAGTPTGTTPRQQGGLEVPNMAVALPGDGGGFSGSGPGLDFGDFIGPNSFLNQLAAQAQQFPMSIGQGDVQRNLGNPPVLVQPDPRIQGNGGGGGCPVSPFRGGGRAVATAVPFVAVNPISGRPVWFGPLGKPVLWTGDLRACKRVAKVASRAARSRPRRRGRR